MTSLFFDAIKPGLQADGVSVLADLGWAAFSITEQLGIECFVGIAGFDSAQQYFERLRSWVSSELCDWEPVEAELFKCQYRTGEGEYYSAFRVRKDDRAISALKTRVFAARHKSWRLLENGQFKAFHCDRQKSYAKEYCAIGYPGIPFTPEAMRNITDTGFFLAGVPHKEKEELYLTWPSPNLPNVLGMANSLRKKGVANIYLCEGSLAYPFDKLSAPKIDQLLRSFIYYGEEVNFLDLCTSAGLL